MENPRNSHSQYVIFDAANTVYLETTQGAFLLASAPFYAFDWTLYRELMQVIAEGIYPPVSTANSMLLGVGASTKQTARKQTGSKAPRRALANVAARKALLKISKRNALKKPISKKKRSSQKKAISKKKKK